MIFPLFSPFLFLKRRCVFREKERVWCFHWIIDFMRLCVYVCGCVCVWEREREIFACKCSYMFMERGWGIILLNSLLWKHVFVCECECLRSIERVCVCVWSFDIKSAWVSYSVSVCVCVSVTLKAWVFNNFCTHVSCLIHSWIKKTTVKS